MDIQQNQNIYIIEQSSKRRTIGWILLGLLLVGIILVFSRLIWLQNKPQETSLSQEPAAQPTIGSQNIAFTTLSLSPSKKVVSVGEIFQIPLVIETNSNTAGIVQLKVQYDPTLISIESIKEGDFFSKPTVYTNKIDKQTGMVTYIIGSFDAKSGSGTVATLIARAVRRTNDEQEVLSILPKTKVTQPQTSSSILKNATGTRLTIR